MSTIHDQVRDAVFKIAAKEAASIEAFLRGQNAQPGEWVLEITKTFKGDPPGISMETRTYRLVPAEKEPRQ